LKKPVCSLTPAALSLLTSYHWPGNVRELENLVTRAAVLSAGKSLDAGLLREWLIDPEGDCWPAEAAAPQGDVLSAGMKLEDMERKLIEATLDHFDGHRVKAAQALGIGVRTLTNKLRLYGYAPRTRSFAKAA
jgi:DNA-binding NtrC family response regulator